MARLFVPLDVNFPDDPKMVNAGPDAEHLYVRGLLLAKRIGGNGTITRGHLYRLCGDFTCVRSGETNPEDLAKALVAEDAWREVEDGWVITAWLEWNSSDEEIEAAREAERARKAAWRASQRDGAGRDADVPAGQGVTATGRDARDSDSDSDSEDSLGCEFDAWWADYPQKKDKAAACKAFKARRRAGVTLETLIRARDNYIAAEVFTDTQYLKRGGTFLNGKDGPWSEYLDAVPPPSKPGPSPVGPAYTEWIPGSA